MGSFCQLTLRHSSVFLHFVLFHKSVTFYLCISNRCISLLFPISFSPLSDYKIMDSRVSPGNWKLYQVRPRLVLPQPELYHTNISKQADFYHTISILQDLCHSKLFPQNQTFAKEDHFHTTRSLPHIFPHNRISTTPFPYFQISVITNRFNTTRSRSQETFSTIRSVPQQSMSRQLDLFSSKAFSTTRYLIHKHFHTVRSLPLHFPTTRFL